MKIRILTVGKMKDDGGFRSMSDFYLKRLKLFGPAEVVELKEKRSLEDETKELLKHTPTGSYLVALREDGRRLDSLKFSEMLRKNRDAGKDMTFFVGGAYGFGDVKEDISISVAPWTLPHQLARIILLEQLYRGFSILSGSKYHHG